MTNQLPSDPQMTDVFGRFPTSLPPANDASEPKINNRKKALLATAAILLGGGAAFAAINFDKISTLVEGDGKPKDSGTPGNSGSDVLEQINASTVPVRHHAASAVQNGTITPDENISIAGNIEEKMTFDQAYATAREETGPGGIFSWHGQVYNTYTVEEWQSLSLGQRQEFLSGVGYRPTQGSQLETRVVSGDPLPPEPDYIELVINGRPALGIDEDHDGIAEAIVVMDEESNTMFAFVDAEGDNRIDTAIQFDPSSQQVIGQQTLDQPFLAEMTQLEAMNNVSEQPFTYDIALVADTENVVDYEDDNDYTDNEGYVNNAEVPEMD